LHDFSAALSGVSSFLKNRIAKHYDLLFDDKWFLPASVNILISRFKKYIVFLVIFKYIYILNSGQAGKVYKAVNILKKDL